MKYTQTYTQEEIENALGIIETPCENLKQQEISDVSNEEIEKLYESLTEVRLYYENMIKKISSPKALKTRNKRHESILEDIPGWKN